MKPSFQLLLNFLRFTPLEPIVTEIQKGIADGKFTFDEGKTLAAQIATTVETYFPDAKPEADIVIDVAKAIDKYEAAKAPKAPPVTSLEVGSAKPTAKTADAKTAVSVAGRASA